MILTKEEQATTEHRAIDALVSLHAERNELLVTVATLREDNEALVKLVEKLRNVLSERK